MLLKATRTIDARELEPGSTIIDPEAPSVTTLTVDAVTRTMDGIELACWPATRTTGKRLVRRLKDGDQLEQVAGPEQAAVLLGQLHGRLTVGSEGCWSAMSDDGGMLLVWTGGWRATLLASMHSRAPVPSGHGAVETEPEDGLAEWNAAGQVVVDDTGDRVGVAVPALEEDVPLGDLVGTAPVEPESLAGPKDDLVPPAEAP